jgi:two-component system, OmpR family, phosphate regulon sensor histidine kinase PhoR
MVIPSFRRRSPTPDDEVQTMAVEAARGRFLIEESPEVVLVLDADDIVLRASRRTRDLLPAVVEGEHIPPELLRNEGGRVPVVIEYEAGGERERLIYLIRDAGEVAAYEELRAGFTAAVSHELRTPLARLLVLLETAELPGADASEVIARARAEVGEMGELIDDVLFLSELETGREVVSLGTTPAGPVLREVSDELRERSARAGVTVVVECDEGLELPLRPRMLRVVAANLAENALRHAGERATFTIGATRDGDRLLLTGSDDGKGVGSDDLPRLFERFYRTDQARSSRGTGLGLAIVKHIVAAAEGSVEAHETPGGGLTIVCSFPA